jgi:hypothetical protein
MMKSSDVHLMNNNPGSDIEWWEVVNRPAAGLENIVSIASQPIESDLKNKEENDNLMKGRVKDKKQEINSEKRCNLKNVVRETNKR